MKRSSIIAAAVPLTAVTLAAVQSAAGLAACVAAGLASGTAHAQGLSAAPVQGGAALGGAALGGAPSGGAAAGGVTPSVQQIPSTPQVPPRRRPEPEVPGLTASGGGPQPPAQPATESAGTPEQAGGANPGSAAPRMRRLTAAEYKQATKDIALFQAAWAGETWKVRDALARGAKIGATDWQYGFTPLMWASIKGRLGTVRYLLKRGAKPDTVSRRGVAFPLAASPWTRMAAPSPAGQSYFSGQHRTTLYATNGGVTALHLAAGQGYNLTVRELLAHKAGPNLAEPDGGTPLMLAAFSANLPSVRALLGAGANVNAVDVNGLSALYFAASENNAAMVRLLLSKGAKVRATKGRLSPDIVAETKQLGFAQVSAILAAAAAREKPDPRRQQARKTPQASGPGIILLN